MKLGCFGMPSIFSFRSKVCENCGEFSPCQHKSYSKLLTIKSAAVANTLVEHESYRRSLASTELSDADHHTPNHTMPAPKRSAHVGTKRVELTEAQLLKIAPLSKKAAAFVKKLLVRDFKPEASGLNPFDSGKHRSSHLAFEMLMDSHVSKSDFRTAFIQELGWTYNSASVEVAILWQSFPALGLAITSESFMSLHPSLIPHNQP